jgi:hypothetical protein
VTSDDYIQLIAALEEPLVMVAGIICFAYLFHAMIQKL